MAGLMVGAAVLSALLLPRLADAGDAAPRVARHDLLGFLAVLAAVAVGYAVTRPRSAAAGARAAGAAARRQQRSPRRCRRAGPTWLALLLGIAFTLPLAAWAARRARFETLLGGPVELLRQPGAAAFLLFIVLYKLGDAFAGSLMTPFLLQAWPSARPRSAWSTRSSACG